MPLALGVDTSNYATSLAVVDATSGEVVCAKKRLLPVPDGQKGLRQSDAVFYHTQALPQLLGELSATCDFKQVSTAGVSSQPRPVEGSYMPCFLTGMGFAAAFAAGRGIPCYETSHQQGHLAAAISGSGQPCLFTAELLFFHVSGGTTELLLAEGYEIKKQLGGTSDLYEGQLADRLGVRLGFPFPAGAALSALALECEERPDPKVSISGTTCHLSGLQNQCEGLLAKGAEPAYVARYCLTAIAKSVAGVLQNAQKEYRCLPILCAGGVMSSDVIRPYLTEHIENLYFAPPELSSDNAVGVALIAAKEACLG